MARDLVAIMDDIPADSFDLDMTIILPADVRAELDRSAELREQAARSQAQAAGLARRLRARPGVAASGRRQGTRSLVGARQAVDRRSRQACKLTPAAETFRRRHRQIRSSRSASGSLISSCVFNQADERAGR